MERSLAVVSCENRMGENQYGILGIHDGCGNSHECCFTTKNSLKYISKSEVFSNSPVYLCLQERFLPEIYKEVCQQKAQFSVHAGLFQV